MVTYLIENFCPKIDYVFQFIFRIIGIKGLRAAQNFKDPVDIYYGNNPKTISYKIRIIEKKDDIIWRKLLGYESALPENELGFDIINAIGLLLTDEVNRETSEESYDRHERLIFNKSFQCKQNVVHIPLVNVYVLFLKSLLEKILSVYELPLWPDGKKCAIGLSHDVDEPDKYAILKSPLFIENANFKNSFFINVRKAKAIIKRLWDRNPNDFWLFKEIMDEEEKLGVKSTFFFASMNLFSEWGSRYDVAYEIDSPDFRKVFEEIVNRGFEIGLHASYNAYRDSNRFFIEKQKLTKISRFEVKGIRHHFWHLGRIIEQTFEMHEKTGFEYDSSITFNEKLGFRTNIAFPYPIWDKNGARTLKVIQLPVFCMDSNLFPHPVEANDAVEKVKIYIETIKQFGGLGVIDWHVRTSYPKNNEYLNWGGAYVKIIKYLSTDSEIWTTNLGEITSWMRKREHILSSNVS